MLTKLDLRVFREQNVLALDVSVDDFVLVEVRKALWNRERRCVRGGGLIYLQRKRRIEK